MEGVHARLGLEMGQRLAMHRVVHRRQLLLLLLLWGLGTPVLGARQDETDVFCCATSEDVGYADDEFAPARERGRGGGSGGSGRSGRNGWVLSQQFFELKEGTMRWDEE